MYKTFTTGLSPVGKPYNRPAGEGNAFPLWWLRHHLAWWEACHMIQKVNPVTPLASPLGEEGHEVAKGWTVVRMIMIFLFYVLSP